MFKMHHLVHVIFSLKAEPYSGNNAYNAASKIKAYSALIGRLPLLDRQIDSSLYERTRLSKPKVSAVLRQITPEAERVFRDQYVMEFITGKESKPEYLGQLNFYLKALDRDVKKPKENPSIGVLLCKDKDDEVVEYALSRSLSPTMVAEYRLNMPDKNLLRDKLKEIEDTGDNYK